MKDNRNLDLESLVCRDSDGVVAVSFALLCTLYLRQDYEPERRRRLKDFVRSFVDAGKDELHWLLPTSTGAQQVTSENILRKVEAMLEGLDDADDTWELHVHGGETAEAAASIGLEIFLRRRWEAEPPHNHLGFVSFRFPLLWYRDKRPGFPSFVLSSCALLQPVHGYAGIGVVIAADRFLAARFEGVVTSLAERFPGLEIDYPVKHLIWVRAGIKSVNWLTILGDELIVRMGGLDRLRALIPASATPHVFPGGCLIQASGAPQLGDRNRRLGVDEYRELAIALKPIRITTHSAVHGGDGLDRARFERWLARFDE